MLRMHVIHFYVFSQQRRWMQFFCPSYELVLSRLFQYVVGIQWEFQ